MTEHETAATPAEILAQVDVLEECLATQQALPLDDPAVLALEWLFMQLRAALQDVQRVDYLSAACHSVDYVAGARLPWRVCNTSGGPGHHTLREAIDAALSSPEGASR